MARDKLSFLDLPKELRLNVYDNFLTRQHCKIAITPYSFSESITLVRPQPIPPVHLTCKFLLAEVGSYLKPKLERMSVEWATPRLIIHPRVYKDLPTVNDSFESDLLNDLFPWMQQSKAGKPVDVAVLSKRIAYHTKEEPSAADLEVIRSHIEYAGRYLARHQVPAEDYYDEAEEILTNKSAENGFWDLSSDEAEVKILKLVDELMEAPDARVKGLQIIIHFDDGYFPDGEEVLEKLALVADACYLYDVRACVQTFVDEYPTVVFKDRERWVRYDGNVDEKTWIEEWA
tara:strand:- start:33328 stop:34191 length:864 start_codon:yes stop_codon:yes gene_type:complete